MFARARRGATGVVTVHMHIYICTHNIYIYTYICMYTCVHTVCIRAKIFAHTHVYKWDPLLRDSVSQLVTGYYTSLISTLGPHNEMRLPQADFLWR